MASFQITIPANRRAAARLIGDVHRSLLTAFGQKSDEGLTQSEIARMLGVHRSVINRELRGAKDMTIGRVGELAWAMGKKAVLTLEDVRAKPLANSHPDPAPSFQTLTKSASSVVDLPRTQAVRVAA